MSIKLEKMVKQFEESVVGFKQGKFDERVANIIDSDCVFSSAWILKEAVTNGYKDETIRTVSFLDLDKRLNTVMAVCNTYKDNFGVNQIPSFVSAKFWADKFCKDLKKQYLVTKNDECEDVLIDIIKSVSGNLAILVDNVTPSDLEEEKALNKLCLKTAEIEGKCKVANEVCSYVRSVSSFKSEHPLISIFAKKIDNLNEMESLKVMQKKTEKYSETLKLFSEKSEDLNPSTKNELLKQQDLLKEVTIANFDEEINRLDESYVPKTPSKNEPSTKEAKELIEKVRTSVLLQEIRSIRKGIESFRNHNEFNKEFTESIDRLINRLDNFGCTKLETEIKSLIKKSVDFKDYKIMNIKVEECERNTKSFLEEKTLSIEAKTRLSTNLEELKDHSIRDHIKALEQVYKILTMNDSVLINKQAIIEECSLFEITSLFSELNVSPLSDRASYHMNRICPNSEWMEKKDIQRVVNCIGAEILITHLDEAIEADNLKLINEITSILELGNLDPQDLPSGFDNMMHAFHHNIYLKQKEKFQSDERTINPDDHNLLGRFGRIVTDCSHKDSEKKNFSFDGLRKLLHQGSTQFSQLFENAHESIEEFEDSSDNYVEEISNLSNVSMDRSQDTGEFNESLVEENVDYSNYVAVQKAISSEVKHDALKMLVKSLKDAWSE